MLPSSRRPPRVTILQVAKAAGVDRSTVSRVYNRPELLSADTISNVKSVANRLGYAPNSAARALRTGRSDNIALIVPDLTNPFMPPIALAVQKQAAKSGICVFIGNADEDPSQEQDLVARFSDQVCGVVLVSPRSSEKVISTMAGDMPMVLINRDIAGINRVLIDSGQGMAQVVARLSDLGHKKIIYVGGPANSWANEQRYLAVAKAAIMHNLQLTEISAGAASFTAGTKVVPDLLSGDSTAVIAFDDVLAQGILVGFEERNIHVPHDYNVVGCDDVLGYPALTTVSSPSEEAGRTAVEILLKSLKEAQNIDFCKILETNLIARETIGPAASHK